MILQTPVILQYIVIYLPPALFMSFSAAILAFGYLIRKKNRYTYGSYFMISACLSIIPHIIFYATNLPMLTFNLFQLNLPWDLIYAIINGINALTLGLDLLSALFLLIALYYLYKTHKTPRTEPDTNF